MCHLRQDAVFQMHWILPSQSLKFCINIYSICILLAYINTLFVIYIQIRFNRSNRIDTFDVWEKNCSTSRNFEYSSTCRRTTWRTSSFLSTLLQKWWIMSFHMHLIQLMKNVENKCNVCKSFRLWINSRKTKVCQLHFASLIQNSSCGHQ